MNILILGYHYILIEVKLFCITLKLKQTNYTDFEMSTYILLYEFNLKVLKVFH